MAPVSGLSGHGVAETRASLGSGVYLTHTRRPIGRKADKTVPRTPYASWEANLRS
jgi:hypothetical protein